MSRWWWLAAALLATCPSVAARDPLPYRLSVQVAHGRQVAPESVREELESELLASLARAGCFTRVGRPGLSTGPPDDLWFTVSLDRLEDETQYDASIAERSAADRPPGEAEGYVAQVEIDVIFELGLADRAEPFRTQRRHFEQRMRPLLPNSDAREDVRVALMEMIVRAVRNLLCSGSAKSWEKELARVRGG